MEYKFGFGFGHNSDAADSELYKLFADEIMMMIFITFISIFGLVGNGLILWLLGFHIKRNPFTTYILHLAVADFGSLLFLLHIHLFFLMELFSDFSTFDVAYMLLSPLLLMYSGRHCLLTTISIDRCLVVLRPDWYYHHRSPNFATTVSTLIWVSLLLPFGIQLALLFTGEDSWFELIIYQYFVIASVCLPLTTMSTLTLFIRVCFKFQMHRKGKLLIVTLLVLLFSLFFSFLTYAFLIARYFQANILHLGTYTSIYVSLESSIHALIYLSAWSWKDCQNQDSVKVTLQRVFKEEEQQHTMETRL